MIVRSKRALAGTAAMVAAMLVLSGCDTAGSSRVASIGGGDTGTGSSSGSGSGGSDTGTGTSGDDGGTSTTTGSGAPVTHTGGGSGGTGTGVLSSLPIGSITGNGGVLGTDIAGNIGQAGEPSPLASVLATAGNATLGLADATSALTGSLGTATGLSRIIDPATQTVANVCTALNGAATGDTPLLDGLTSALAPTATLALGSTTLLGDGSGTSLVAISAGSPASGSGSLVDLHLANEAGLPAANTLVGVTLGTPTGPGLITDLTAMEYEAV